MQHTKCCTKNLTIFKIDPASSNMLQHIATCRKIDPAPSKMLQHIAKCRNRIAKRMQHVVPNNVARCCVEMLRAFGQALIHAKLSAYADNYQLYYSNADPFD